jgi:hypothetical protein
MADSRVSPGTRSKYAHGVAERGAPPLEDERRLIGDVVLPLVDEARLAATGAAHDGHHLRRPTLESPERGLELAQLGAPSDVGREPALGGDGHGHGGFGGTEDLVGGHGLALAAHLERPRGAHAEAAADEAVRRLAHEHGAGRRERLQARGEVRRVADRRVVHLQVVADRADDDRSGMDADPRLEDLAAVGEHRRAEAPDRLLDGERGEHRVLRGVLLCHRGAEERHEAVAGEHRDDALIAVDLREGELEILVEEVVVLLGIELLGDRRRAGEIAEEDRHLLPLALDVALCRADLVREGRGDAARETVEGAAGRCRRRPWDLAAALGAETELR